MKHLYLLFLFIAAPVFSFEYRSVCDIRKSVDDVFRIRIESAEDACLNKKKCNAANYQATIMTGEEKIIWITTLSDILAVGSNYLVFAKKLDSDRRIFYKEKLFYNAPDKINYFIEADAIFIKSYDNNYFRKISKQCSGTPDCDIFPNELRGINSVLNANIVYPNFEDDLKNCK